MTEQEKTIERIKTLLANIESDVKQIENLTDEILEFADKDEE